MDVEQLTYDGMMVDFLRGLDAMSTEHLQHLLKWLKHESSTNFAMFTPIGWNDDPTNSSHARAHGRFLAAERAAGEVQDYLEKRERQTLRDVRAESQVAFIAEAINRCQVYIANPSTPSTTISVTADGHVIEGYRG